MGPYTQSMNGHTDNQKLADHIQRIFELPASATDAVVSAIAASSEQTGISYIDAEIASFPSRFGFDNADNSNDTANQPKLDQEQNVTAARSHLTFIGHHMPPTVPAGATAYRSVRFRAEQLMHATGPLMTELAYQWTSTRGGILGRWSARLRRPDTCETFLTRLPIDIFPGREITLPIKLRTPVEPGPYELSIFPVGPNVTPASVTHLRINLEVGASTSQIDNVHVGETIPDYGVDHIAGLKLLQDFTSAAYQTGFTILEVASGVNPHTAPLAASGMIIASDVCSNQMQLGAIFSHYKLPSDINANVGFASFDAFNAPFQPEQFDGVVLFSALHHFPDPAAFLEKLAGLVRPDGFIAVLCEPCDPSAYSQAYIRDLSAGINEQMFSVEEYQHIFSQAGLKAHTIRNDGGSLKAILRRSA